MVRDGDQVPFKYGSQTFSEGEVLFSSATEDRVLKEIQSKKHVKKSKREESFHEDQPRKAVLKVLNNNNRPALSTSKESNSKKDVKNKAQKKKFKRSAEAAMDASWAEKENENIESDSPNSSNCSSHSVDSNSSGSSIDDDDGTQPSKLRSDINSLQSLEHPPSPSTESEPDEQDNSSALTPKQSQNKSHVNSSSVHSSRESVKRMRRDMSPDSLSDSCNEELEMDGEELRRKLREVRSLEKYLKLQLAGSVHQSQTVKRNLEVYNGQNYLWREDDDDVVQLHDRYKVYVKCNDLDMVLSSVKSVTQFIRCITDKVCTKEALCNATPQGFPPRSRGSLQLRNHTVLPRLHPDGRAAILARAQQLEDTKKAWRPRVGASKMAEAFSGICSLIRRLANNESLG
ncbi:Halomucin [Frankliniella fusca]|uniref:Halomucin n=1 Tax=Frankliniella fusca TaxID=407009 RepID=A0AAE1I2P0_9NEOP|nr:Halomucin [Frankliniella fusca]